MIMKTKTINLHWLITISAIIFSMLLLSFILQGDDEWVVPDKYKNMENPTDDSKQNLTIGKNLYNKHCKSCHGAEGLGDGTKAAQLDTPCGDFSSEEFQSQSDGALFYKTTEGRDEMPAFNKTIGDDEDRWLIVRYMRTFK